MRGSIVDSGVWALVRLGLVVSQSDFFSGRLVKKILYELSSPAYEIN